LTHLSYEETAGSPFGIGGVEVMGFDEKTHMEFAMAIWEILWPVTPILTLNSLIKGILAFGSFKLHLGLSKNGVYPLRHFHLNGKTESPKVHTEPPSYN